jgi:DNA-binding LacI/PurR family transcriptional regulator
VVSDYLHGSYIAVMHLFDSGCGDIGILVLTPRTSSERDRIAGYELAHRKRGVAIRPDLTCRCVSSQVPNSAAICYAATTELLCLPRPPDGLFVANQTLMINALRALSDLGLRIPNDVAVIGFGDDPWLERLAVPVSAIAEQREQLGARAAQLLLRRLHGDRPPNKPVVEVVPTRMVVRGSTAKRSLREEFSLSPR